MLLLDETFHFPPCFSLPLPTFLLLFLFGSSSNHLSLSFLFLFFFPSPHRQITQKTDMGTVEVFNGADLNPNAKEWNPIYDCAPEEDRCLFLTFSNGFPLTEHQIVTFFTRYVRLPIFFFLPTSGKIKHQANSIYMWFMQVKNQTCFKWYIHIFIYVVLGSLDLLCYRTYPLLSNVENSERASKGCTCIIRREGNNCHCLGRWCLLHLQFQQSFLEEKKKLSFLLIARRCGVRNSRLEKLGLGLQPQLLDGDKRKKTHEKRERSSTAGGFGLVLCGSVWISPKFIHVCVLKGKAMKPLSVSSLKLINRNLINERFFFFFFVPMNLCFFFFC